VDPFAADRFLSEAHRQTVHGHGNAAIIIHFGASSTAISRASIAPAATVRTALMTSTITLGSLSNLGFELERIGGQGHSFSRSGSLILLCGSMLLLEISLQVSPLVVAVINCSPPPRIFDGNASGFLSFMVRGTLSSIS
jgi:hypothetical protein